MSAGRQRGVLTAVIRCQRVSGCQRVPPTVSWHALTPLTGQREISGFQRTQRSQLVVSGISGCPSWALETFGLRPKRVGKREGVSRHTSPG